MQTGPNEDSSQEKEKSIDDIHSDPKLYNVEAGILLEHAMKFDEYRRHLKHRRLFWWVALVVAAILLFWWGESDRYKMQGNTLILDTKTGTLYDARTKIRAK